MGGHRSWPPGPRALGANSIGVLLADVTIPSSLTVASLTEASSIESSDLPVVTARNLAKVIISEGPEPAGAADAGPGLRVTGRALAGSGSVSRTRVRGPDPLAMQCVRGTSHGPAAASVTSLRVNLRHGMAN